MKEMLSKSSRVYSVVKNELLDGTLRAGEWIDVPALALRVGVSPTPVQHGLFLLAGEGLIQAHDRQGFHTPNYDEENLRDLFVLRTDLFLMATSSAASEGRAPDLTQIVPKREEISRAITGLFLDLAAAGRRPQLREMIERLDDRLRLVQSVKLEIVPGLEEEYFAIAGAWKQRDLSALAEIVTNACQRRLALVPEMLTALRRSRSKG